MAQDRTVTVIPARPKPMQVPGVSVQKRRTAGYARVSTEKDEQFTSYEAQIDYYTRFIQMHPDWEFVKVYTDEGITGTSTRHRDGFNEMVEDALAGKIDLIVTKSVSRFARNTVDSLVTIRRLKEKGVEVYFEKENIFTFDGKGELLLTIMSSIAQEESRSISENVTWGQRKRFSDGKITLPYKQFLGYEKGQSKDDPPVVNPQQAELVRRIYSLYMQGMTTTGIARTLTQEGIKTPAGKDKWRQSTIASILQNEKYKGAARLQKTFTVDFLSGKRKDNDGEVPQYYIEHSHEAIIPPDEWDAVQAEILRRKTVGRQYSGKNVLATRIVCGDCGSYFGPKVWHSNSQYRCVILQCNQKFHKDTKCSTPHFKEEEVQQRFLRTWSAMRENRQGLLEDCRAIWRFLTDTAEIDRAIQKYSRELREITALTEQCIAENASVAQDQQEYLERYARYERKYAQAEKELERLQGAKRDRLNRADKLDGFMQALSDGEEELSVFDEHLFLATVEKIIAQPDGKLTFCFYDGREVEG